VPSNLNFWTSVRMSSWVGGTYMNHATLLFFHLLPTVGSSCNILPGKKWHVTSGDQNQTKQNLGILRQLWKMQNPILKMLLMPPSFEFQRLRMRLHDDHDPEVPVDAKVPWDCSSWQLLRLLNWRVILVDVGVPPMKFLLGWCLVVKYVRFKRLSGLVEFYYASISFVWGLLTLTPHFWWCTRCTRATSACLRGSPMTWRTWWILRMASCTGGRVEAHHVQRVQGLDSTTGAGWGLWRWFGATLEWQNLGMVCGWGCHVKPAW